jgi:hypothetical protein
MSTINKTKPMRYHSDPLGAYELDASRWLRSLELCADRIAPTCLKEDTGNDWKIYGEHVFSFVSEAFCDFCDMSFRSEWVKQ